MADLAVDGLLISMRRALALSVVLGGVLVCAASANAQSEPQPDVPWGGCKLSQTTINSLAADMEVSSPKAGNKPKVLASNAIVDAVIVLRLDTTNWGQQLSTNSNPSVGFTARIVCSALDVSTADDSESARFPAQGNIDILNADETLAIRAIGLSNSGSNAGKHLARICLTSNTTASSTNLEVDPVTCFRLVLD